jgi:hypothetical protein
MACDRCQSCGWVCENHSHTPWSGMVAGVDCCGGAGAPCPDCNGAGELLEHTMRTIIADSGDGQL